MPRLLRPGLTYTTASGFSGDGLTVEATRAALFPDSASPAFDGLFTATDLTFTADLNEGGFTLTAGPFDFRVGTVLEVSAMPIPGMPQGTPAVTLSFHPDQAPEAVLATVQRAVIRSPDFPELTSVEVNNVVISRTGFTLEHAVLGGETGIDIRVEDWLRVDGLKIEVIGLAFDVQAEPRLTGQVIVTSTGAALFPDQDAFAATVTNFGGSLMLQDPGDSLVLSADRVTVRVGDLVHFFADNVVITPGAPSGAPVATLAQAQLRALVPGLDSDVAVSGGDITVRRTDIHFGQLGVSFDGTIGAAGLFTVTGLEIQTTDLTLDFTSGPHLSEPVTVTLASANLFDGLATLGPLARDGEPALPALQGTIDAQGNSSWEFGLLTATVAGVFTVTAEGGELNFGPGAQTAPLLRVDRATARLDALPDVTFTVTGFALHQDRHFSLLTAEAASVSGLAHSLGIAEFLPFEVNSLRVEFDPPAVDGGPTDFSTFRLTTTGYFDFVQFKLPFTPTVRIGEASANPGAPGNPFEFTLQIDTATHTVRPLESGTITLGIADLQIGELYFAGELTLGSYVEGEFVPAIAGFLKIDSEHPDNKVTPAEPLGPDDADVSYSFESLRLAFDGSRTLLADKKSAWISCA